MAPDAAPPTYDSHGNQVSAWSVTVEYDVTRDVVSVRWRIEPGPYNKGSHGAQDLPYTDLEDAVSLVQRTVRICGARRLF